MKIVFTILMFITLNSFGQSIAGFEIGKRLPGKFEHKNFKFAGHNVNVYTDINAKDEVTRIIVVFRADECDDFLKAVNDTREEVGRILNVDVDSETEFIENSDYYIRFHKKGIRNLNTWKKVDHMLIKIEQNR